MATTDTLPTPHAEAPLETTRIRPSRGWRAIDLRELWRYREMLWFLTLRDIKLHELADRIRSHPGVVRVGEAFHGRPGSPRG